MDLLATVANSRNYKFTQSTPFFPFLIFRVEGIGSKPNDVSSSRQPHIYSSLKPPEILAAGRVDFIICFWLASRS
ncbi:hypothetical protein T03_6849 [Trichinella britovi]|uniref:Uncharacterized protein n=1 Tax=Trichinella britovi TaxID=45882 RepID=A0A0V1AL95_TRIBR|nr:hypothetical protein T03_6849 [Trichinella britovi]